MSNTKPEIANTIKTGNFMTNYHDVGSGFPLLLLHGSGPGVTAWANWRLVIPEFSKKQRVLAPDLVGFGYTERPEGVEYSMDNWVQQAIDFLDALNIEKTDVVGNSFGGALAIALAVKYPERIRKVVLMGSMGVNFEITYGLDFVWGYEPSIENMKKTINLFVVKKEILTDDLAKMRYEASIEPGFQEAFSSMFPAPRQEWVEAMAKYEASIPNIQHKTLIVHGREDQVIPLENALKLIELIPNAELHIFGQCGHWTQIEKSKEFTEVVKYFLAQE